MPFAFHTLFMFFRCDGATCSHIVHEELKKEILAFARVTGERMLDIHQHLQR